MTDQEAWVVIGLAVFVLLPSVITFGICYCKSLDHSFRILHPADATQQWTWTQTTVNPQSDGEDDEDDDEDERNVL